jgi:phosphatidate cytidylyltransferase
VYWATAKGEGTVIERIVAAAAGLLIVMPAFLWGGVLAMEIIVVLVSLVVLTEYAAMAFPEDRTVSLGWLGLCWTAVYGSRLYLGADQAIGAGFLVVISTMIFVTLRPGPEISQAADRVGRYLLGVGWIALLGTVILLRREPSGLAWVFVILVISWCGDTGGYFAGRFFGKHKLYPRISPKKTWEGVAGGVAFAIGGLFALRAGALPVLTPFDCVLMGSVFCLMGIVGDLGESMLKRAFNVKDSGWIMPGHGGLLDRIDSVLFVAPLVYGYAVWVKGL